MRIAVLSDVHANIVALDAVFDAIDAVGVDEVWCLGDTTGYGPDVNECLRAVIGRCSIVLAGNHDMAVRGDYPAQHLGGTAGAGVIYALDVIDLTLLEALKSLRPLQHRGGEDLFHGSALDPAWEYVKDRRTASRHLAAQVAGVSFVGHSHIQLAFALEPDGSSVGDFVMDGGTLELDDRKYVINPGSVGQPRDGNPKAGWALYDDQARTIAWYRIEYDVAAAQARVRAAGLPERTAARLAEGW